jgi:hypothetical protein
MLRARNSTTSRVPAARVTTNLGVVRLANDSFDTAWNDLTSHHYNGEDHTGGAWPLFDGVGDYIVAPGPYVQGGLGEPPNLPITADLTSATMECWIKPAGLAAKSRLISINSASREGYLMVALWTTGELKCYVDTGPRAQSAPGVITVGPWFHIAMTAGNGVAPVIYLNGADVTLAGATAAPYPQSNSQIAVGATLYNPGPSTTQRFHGDIDTVRVYERILSPDEVLMNYNAGLAAHQ